MSHHIDDQGRFQSDKHPDLPPDRIRVNFVNPRSQRALYALAVDYEDKDAGLAEDIKARLTSLGYEPDSPRPPSFHPTTGKPLPIVLFERDVWAGLGRHTSLIEVEFDAVGEQVPRAIRYLTPKAAETLACQLLLAAVAGKTYGHILGRENNDGLVTPERLSEALQRMLVELGAKLEPTTEETS